MCYIWKLQAASRIFQELPCVKKQSSELGAEVMLVITQAQTEKRRGTQRLKSCMELSCLTTSWVSTVATLQEHLLSWDKRIQTEGLHHVIKNGKECTRMYVSIYIYDMYNIIYIYYINKVYKDASASSAWRRSLEMLHMDVWRLETWQLSSSCSTSTRLLHSWTHGSAGHQGRRLHRTISQAAWPRWHFFISFILVPSFFISPSYMPIYANIN